MVASHTILEVLKAKHDFRCIRCVRSCPPDAQTPPSSECTEYRQYVGTQLISAYVLHV